MGCGWRCGWKRAGRCGRPPRRAAVLLETLCPCLVSYRVSKARKKRERGEREKHLEQSRGEEKRLDLEMEIEIEIEIEITYTLSPLQSCSPCNPCYVCTSSSLPLSPLFIRIEGSSCNTGDSTFTPSTLIPQFTKLLAIAYWNIFKYIQSPHS